MQSIPLLRKYCFEYKTIAKKLYNVFKGVHTDKIHAHETWQKFILLINVKMPTIVGILTFISMINTTSERLKVRNVFICRY